MVGFMDEKFPVFDKELAGEFKVKEKIAKKKEKAVEERKKRVEKRVKSEFKKAPFKLKFKVKM